MKNLFPLLAVAASAAFPLFADDEYAVTAATSSAQTFALYTSAAATPTYALTSGALSSPFNITYRDGETVSVTSPNGVTTALSGSGGTIEYVPASGGLWTFANSNGKTALVGVDWSVHDDAPAPAEAAAFTMLKEQLMSVLSTLTPREEMVLKLRFGLEDGRARTLEEVGKEFKVTRERIRQIEAKALRKLRHPSRSRKLKDSID